MDKVYLTELLKTPQSHTNYSTSSFYELRSKYENHIDSTPKTVDTDKVAYTFHELSIWHWN
jgi:hypothetical protein